MSRINLIQKLKSGLMLLDGAMGTELIQRGVEPGKCSDNLNLEQPEVVMDVHRTYIKAGSDVVITNTFGANKFALARHGLSEKVKQINTAGAELARKAAGNEKYVLGDIGPTGDFLEPLGNLSLAEMKNAFTEQAKALAETDIDGFIIETMTSLDEATLAIEAAKSAADLPVLASLAFDRAGDGFRTMMGVDAGRAVSQLTLLGVSGIGFNCGTMEPDDYIEMSEIFAESIRKVGQDVLLFAEPNAGLPELVGDKAVYNLPVDEFVRMAKKISENGFSLIGGCCGTNPDFIAAMKKELK